MVGKFLLGMVSGSLLVAGGLVIGSAVAPMRPANDNAKAPAAETAIAAPKATAPEAGKTTEPAPDSDAATQTSVPSPKANVASDAPVTEKIVAPAEQKPDVAATQTAPVAPQGTGDSLAEAVAPALAEVAKPEPAATAPAKPAEAATDSAAATPETTAPAKETMLAQAEEPAAAPKIEPATAPVETAAAPAPATGAETATKTEPKPATEAGTDAAKPAEVSTEAPAAAPAAASEPVLEPAPAAPEPEPAPAAKDPAAKGAATDAPAAAEVATKTPAAEAPAEAAPAGEAGNTKPSATMPEVLTPGADSAKSNLPGTAPKAMPGTPEPTLEKPVEPEVPATGSTFKPAPRLIDQGKDVLVERGDKPATSDAAPDPNAATQDARPIVRFAATFENPDGKRPMAIVLIDRGNADLDRARLAALPFPVSFALDPLDPATPERAAIYRAAGREVVMLATGIAKGAQASDVEIAFQTMDQVLPEAVAVMDLAEPSFQNNRGLASAVVPILKAEGRGLLTWDAGLNAADQVARRDDLEAAVVFRDLGTAGTDKTAIRRLLDRAVFKAGQDGRVAVVGEANAETVAALLEWSVEGKAATVALAPVTAVLKVD